MRIVHLVAMFLFLAATVPTAANAAILFGVGNNGNDLFTVDSVTGVMNNIGVLPGVTGVVQGLTGTATGNLLYTDGSTPSVFELNPANAAVINTTSLLVNATGGLSFDTPTNTLYSINDGAGVVSQSPLGGAVNFGFLGVNPDFPGALGGDDNGRHFVWDNNGIQEFNTAGAIVNTIPPPAPLSGLAYDGQFLYASTFGGVGLFTLDPNTGAVISSVNTASPLDGLAALPTAPVPEASTVISWLLMGLTSLGLVWYRRRRA